MSIDTPLESASFSMTELWQMSGLALGRAIASREVSAVEVLDALVARVEAVNPAVSAIVTLVAERVRQRGACC